MKGNYSCLSCTDLRKNLLVLLAVCFALVSLPWVTMTDRLQHGDEQFILTASQGLWSMIKIVLSGFKASTGYVRKFLCYIDGHAGDAWQDVLCNQVCRAYIALLFRYHPYLPLPRNISFLFQAYLLADICTYGKHKHIVLVLLFGKYLKLLDHQSFNRSGGI